MSGHIMIFLRSIRKNLNEQEAGRQMTGLFFPQYFSVRLAARVSQLWFLKFLMCMYTVFFEIFSCSATLITASFRLKMPRWYS